MMIQWECAQFEAEEERKLRQLSSLQAVSPSPHSPLSIASTPMGPSRTTSGMHFTRTNPLAEATPAGPSISPGAFPAGFSRLRARQAMNQEDSDEESSSSPNAVDEPYLRNNPAFEAYLDSDSDSTCSMESNACTTPRSAIQDQVAGSPWLGRVQTFIQSPQSGSAGRAVAKSAPPTVQRGAAPEPYSKDGAGHGQTSSIDLRNSVTRALFAPPAEPGSSPEAPALWHQDAAQRPAQPAFGRHTAPVSPCREWALDDTPQAGAQVREAAAVVDRLHEGVARAAAAVNAAGDGAASPAGREVLRAAAVVDRLQAGVQRQAAALRCAQAARAATAAAGPGPGAEAMQDAAAQPDSAHLPRQQNLQADGVAQLPRQQLLHSGEAAAGAQELVHSWQSAAMAGDAARMQEGEVDAKLGKRMASLSILASGCSETAEAPAAPADAGVSQAGWATTAKSPEKPLPQPTQKGRDSRGSWLRSALLLSALTALLGSTALLLAGHHMAGSQDRLAALHSGFYGSAAASFGRCMSQLQPLAHMQQAQGSADSLGRIVGREAACMYSAARREIALTWQEVHPSLSSHVSTARTAAGRATASLSTQLSPIRASVRGLVARGAAACHLTAERLAASLSERCPACVGFAEAAAARVGGLAQAGSDALGRWHAASGAGELTAPPSSELYHGATLLHRLPQQLSAAKDGFAAKVLPVLAGAVPAQASEAAGHLRAKLAGGWATWAALLEQSARAVLPDDARASAERPAADAADAPQAAEGRLGAAARAAGAWFGGWLGSETEPAAGDLPQEYEADDVSHAPEAPAQTHVLRWPGRGGHQSSESTPEELEPADAASESKSADEGAEASEDALPEQAADSQQEQQSEWEAEEGEIPLTDRPCSAREQCTIEDDVASGTSAEAKADGDTAEDKLQNVAPVEDSTVSEKPPLSFDSHTAEEPADEPQADEGLAAAEPEAPATAEGASDLMQSAPQSNEAGEVAQQTADSQDEPADPAEAEASISTEPNNELHGPPQKASRQSWVQRALVLAAALLGTTALALAVYLWPRQASSGQQQLPAAAGGRQGRVAHKLSRFAAEQTCEACEPSMMDLSAHAPSPVLVPSVPQEEAPLETSHRTPRGRPKKGNTPVSRSAGRGSPAQRTPPHTAPAAGSASEPRVTRARTRFAEEMRRTPRATAYPGPWQE
ncbi:hypothetical protein COCSUDRAFT_55463 [Coccomyxa subellipsoidea C-169]|uniref:Uncharacterized protein n=1 Tax=Coccomyxa subellipsoidea (strain C-169) TaxID=574566 RepID=I0Z9Y8_COCSC|nr:hypothetical protein COCSUDRAFT_55463 [Coccomyxa subellipsoidea C-169]EIE27457.1 hypothetical protein COCSUDRAFT_55463 [Coccomyxa subellipsoidea C-169]|eukprot:XP_005652001.1 hypothetical protein COCSUDRAFT_55463 [Coccomyxa subellipsoidea C-169]